MKVPDKIARHVSSAPTTQPFPAVFTSLPVAHIATPQVNQSPYGHPAMAAPHGMMTYCSATTVPYGVVIDRTATAAPHMVASAPAMPLAVTAGPSHSIITDASASTTPYGVIIDREATAVPQGLVTSNAAVIPHYNLTESSVLPTTVSMADRSELSVTGLTQGTDHHPQVWSQSREDTQTNQLIGGSKRPTSQTKGGSPQARHVSSPQIMEEDDTELLRRQALKSMAMSKKVSLLISVGGLSVDLSGLSVS